MIILSRYVVPAWISLDDGEVLRRWYDALDRPWSVRALVDLLAATPPTRLAIIEALEELT